MIRHVSMCNPVPKMSSVEMLATHPSGWVSGFLYLQSRTVTLATLGKSLMIYRITHTQWIERNLYGLSFWRETCVIWKILSVPVPFPASTYFDTPFNLNQPEYPGCVRFTLGKMNGESLHVPRSDVTFFCLAFACVFPFAHVRLVGEPLIRLKFRLYLVPGGPTVQWCCLYGFSFPIRNNIGNYTHIDICSNSLSGCLNKIFIKTDDLYLGMCHATWQYYSQWKLLNTSGHTSKQ